MYLNNLFFLAGLNYPVWEYIYEMPLDVYYGEDCLEFPERVVCFGGHMPSANDLTYVNVSLNAVVRASCQQQSQWHLSRIQQPLDLNYINYNPYFKNTSDFTVVVMDTWMDVDHSQLQGRAKRWKSFVPHDPHRFPEHATHCAGLVGSKDYGTARDAQIASVQILGDDGAGDYASMIQALHYVLTQIRSSTSKNKFVVSLSVGGPQDAAVNRAVESLLPFAPVFVAAGNSAEDACLTSPSSSRLVFTVAASNVFNKFSSFSNFGTCVDLIAPGENIVSLCPRNQLCAMSGTSMATPLSAGLLVNYWAERPELNSGQVMARFWHKLALGVIDGVPAKTVNRFLFKQAAPCLWHDDLDQIVFEGCPFY